MRVIVNGVIVYAKVVRVGAEEVMINERNRAIDKPKKNKNKKISLFQVVQIGIKIILSNIVFILTIANL